MQCRLQQIQALEEELRPSYRAAASSLSLVAVRLAAEGLAWRIGVPHMMMLCVSLDTDLLWQNDRKWCILDADTHAIITAREVAKVGIKRLRGAHPSHL